MGHAHEQKHEQRIEKNREERIERTGRVTKQPNRKNRKDRQSNHTWAMLMHEQKGQARWAGERTGKVTANTLAWATFSVAQARQARQARRTGKVSSWRKRDRQKGQAM